MSVPLKLKSRLVAAIGTLLVHVLLFGLLMLDFSGDDASSQLADPQFDSLDLTLEDLAAEDLSVSPPGKDPLSDQKDKASESISKEQGRPKSFQTTPSFAASDNEEQRPAIAPEDTVIKKIEVVKALVVDTVKPIMQDTISLAKVLEKVQNTPQNTANNADYVKKQREKFQFYKSNYRAILNFKKVYPYALKTREIIETVNEQLSKMTSESDKKALIKETEKRLFKEYETAVRTMSTSQGKLLLKLIARETNKTGYELIKDYKGKFSASFWYGVGRIFGTNLKTEYHREGEDSLIENISNKYNNNDLY